MKKVFKLSLLCAIFGAAIFAGNIYGQERSERPTPERVVSETLEIKKLTPAQFKELQKNADAGDAFALVDLISIYLRGNKDIKVEKDLAKAKEYFKKIQQIADSGDVNALDILAEVYALGDKDIGVEKDLAKAEKYYDKIIAVKVAKTKTHKERIELVSYELELLIDVLGIKAPKCFEKTHIKICPKDFQEAFEKVAPKATPLINESIEIGQEWDKLSGGKILPVDIDEKGKEKILNEYIDDEGKEGKFDSKTFAKLEKINKKQSELGIEIQKIFFQPLQKIAKKYEAEFGTIESEENKINNNTPSTSVFDFDFDEVEPKKLNFDEIFKDFKILTIHNLKQFKKAIEQFKEVDDNLQNKETKTQEFKEFLEKKVTRLLENDSRLKSSDFKILSELLKDVNPKLSERLGKLSEK
ncbi:MAG: hypothetical protein LBQ66_16040 [Planctomycetaceae bacterium]|jgi:hypothetical protein|nr:hypothetical protein [Planctomycetaceae bacterium]